jgi:hypothetical protein
MGAHRSLPFKGAPERPGAFLRKQLLERSFTRLGSELFANIRLGLKGSSRTKPSSGHVSIILNIMVNQNLMFNIVFLACHSPD